MSSEASNISKLPPELLAIIFEIGALLSYWQNGRELKTNSTYPLIISSVCCLWRNIALNIAPAMWSTIVIHPNRTLDIPLLYLGRSGDMLLDITLSPHDVSLMTNIKTAGLLNCVNLILRYSHRWRYLKLNGWNINISDVLRSVRAPYLTKLILFGRNGDHVLSPMFVDDGAPMLSDVSLDGMNKCCGQPTRFLSVQTLCLTEFGIDMDNFEFSSFLESFPSLRRLILQTSGPETMMSRGQKPVTLQNLVELRTSQHMFGSASVKLGLLALNLHAPLLRVVYLSILRSDHVRSFWKSFGSYPNSLPSVEKLTILWTSLDIIFQKVPAVYPNVRDLDVFQDKVMPQVVSDLGYERARYWSSLEKLTIHKWNSQSDDRYLISFVKGLLEWHGRRIQKITIAGYDKPSSVVRLRKALKELEVPLFLDEWKPSTCDY